MLKNAKDAAATEALEIATYTAIERLATSVGDDETARLAASIRTDEERMLARVLEEIPKLTDAVVGADVHGNGSYDVTKTGAADATRAPPGRPRKARAPEGDAHHGARRPARSPGASARRGHRQGRRRAASRTCRSRATAR